MTRVSTRRRHRTPHKTNSRRVAKKHSRKTPFIPNKIIADNWDKNATYRQNYVRLGLVPTVNDVAGGREHTELEIERERLAIDTVSVDDLEGEALKRALGPGQAMIQRDDDGNIISVVLGEEGSDDEEYHVTPKTDVVKMLEQQASEAVSVGRAQSAGEQDWLQRLMDKHGDDLGAMFRDTKLNIYQESVGQLKRRIAKYKATLI
jgi:nucleolar protein 16